MITTPEALRAVLAQLPNRPVAEACGVSLTSVSRWRAGTRTIPLRAVGPILALVGARLEIVQHQTATLTQRTSLTAARREWQRHGNPPAAVGLFFDVVA